MFFTPVIRRTAYYPNNHPSFRTAQRLLDEALTVPLSGNTKSACSLEQDDTSFTLSFDVPGVNREQLSIGIEANVVRIESKPEAARQYKAAYELAQAIDVTASEARLENGVLTLKLAKKLPVSQVSELTIN
jgi:HSP20 family protein